MNDIYDWIKYIVLSVVGVSGILKRIKYDLIESIANTSGDYRELPKQMVWCLFYIPTKWVPKLRRWL